jgi:ABC-2 type transport system permease protein
MIRLSVRAEIIKLTRQRGALFWGFLFIPLFTAFVTLALVGGGPPPLAGAHAASMIQPLHSAARALKVGGNPIAQLFYAIGAAAIFAVEYRHSGWRHIVPRASRWALIVSKFATFALFAALSLALVALGDALVTVALPLLRGSSPVITDLNAAAAGMVILSFLISLLELTVLAGLVALVAVATRSATGAIIAPFLLSLAATMLESYLAGSGGAVIPLPTFAGDALRHWLAESVSTADVRGAGLFGLATLLGWAAASLCATIALFSRQDLVSE